MARRRSCSSVARSTVWACISGSNRTVDRTGSSFARWSAISACLRRSPGYVTTARPTARPRLAPTLTSRPPRSNGSAMAVSIRDATRSASRMLRTGPSRTPNSSEPSRATVSVDRAAASSRRPTSTSSRSPASWPRLSLTTLNRSRSRRMSAIRGAGVAAARRPWPAAPPVGSSCSARRVSSSVRFGSPVRMVVERGVGALRGPRSGPARTAARCRARSRPAGRTGRPPRPRAG